jgi:ABC-type amino acid transport substrate-binding protein
MKNLCVFAFAISSCHVALATDTPSKLLVGIPSGLPGYEIANNNKLNINDPFKRNVTDCIETRLKSTFVWMAYPTKRVIQMLQMGDIDMVFPMGFTEERASALLQSNLTWQNPDVFVSLRPIEHGDKGLRLAARLGSPQHTDYISDGYASVVGAYSYEDLPKMLAKGTVDAVVVPRSVYAEQRDTWPAKTLTLAGRQRSSGFYLQKNDPKKLLKHLNESITYCTATAK